MKRSILINNTIAQYIIDDYLKYVPFHVADSNCTNFIKKKIQNGKIMIYKIN